MEDESARLSISPGEAADQPDSFRHSMERGLEVIYACYSTYYNDYQAVPLVTGLTKLTNEENDWLIERGDPKLTAEAITTLADCGNYFTRAQFMDYDSNLGMGDWFTHLCGEQVVARRGGFCGAMCNGPCHGADQAHAGTFLRGPGVFVDIICFQPEKLLQRCLRQQFSHRGFLASHTALP